VYIDISPLSVGRVAKFYYINHIFFPFAIVGPKPRGETRSKETKSAYVRLVSMQETQKKNFFSCVKVIMAYDEYYLLYQGSQSLFHHRPARPLTAPS
jgi:hypothetical protein